MAANVDSDLLAERRVRVFRYIDFLHTYMRNFIQTELKRRYGEEWIITGVPSRVKERWSKEKVKAISEGMKEEPEINYASLIDYSDIILYNWVTIFREKFKEIDFRAIQRFFKELTRRRHLAYYAKTSISDDDVQLVESLVKRLIIDEGGKRKFERIMNGKELTDGEIKIIGRLMLQLNGYGTIEEIADRIGQPSDLVKTILDSLIRLGLVNTIAGADLASGIITGAPILDKRRKLPKPNEKVYFLTASHEEISKRYPEILQS